MEKHDLVGEKLGKIEMGKVEEVSARCMNVEQVKNVEQQQIDGEQQSEIAKKIEQAHPEQMQFKIVKQVEYVQFEQQTEKDARFESRDSEMMMVCMLDNKDNSDSIKTMATRVASKAKQVFKQLAEAISSAHTSSVSRNCKVTPTLVVAPATFMFQAWTKEPMGSLDDSKRVQCVPDAIDLIEAIAWVRMQLHVLEVERVECLYERDKDQAQLINVVAASIEFDGTFPIASTLVDMLRTVLGNKTVPFMATDTMRTHAYVHHALDEFDRGHGSVVVTVHELLALKLDPSWRAVLDSLTEGSAVLRTSNLALRAMGPTFWRRREKKGFALFEDLAAALERYVEHAPQELKQV